MPTNPLATPEQREIEDLAVRLWSSTPVQEAINRGRAAFLADPRARTEAGKASLQTNLEEIAFSACSCAASQNTADPKILWSLNLPHRWFGRNVPGSRHGVDNPDNIYRTISIDDVSRYEISGEVLPERPKDVSFTVFSAYPGNGEDSKSLGVITLDEIELDAKGRFTLTISPDATPGKSNHLQVKPGAKLVFVRDSMEDWARETPLRLSVRRTAGPPAPPRVSETQLIAEAAAITERANAYWLRSMPAWFGQLPPNALPTGGTNFAYAKQAPTPAQFKLRPDEALVITLDPLGAQYLGFQLADVWGAAFDYAGHTSSLSRAQAAKNDDGTITYVISTADPGVHNWLDPVGVDEGVLLVRYQGVDPARMDHDKKIRFAQVIKLDTIDSVLPAGARRVGPFERRAQIAERSAAYQRRLAEN